jgi:hypothetical protein
MVADRDGGQLQAARRAEPSTGRTSPDEWNDRVHELTRTSMVGTDAFAMTIFDVIAIVALVIVMFVCDATSLSTGANRSNLDLNSRTYPPILPVAP